MVLLAARLAGTFFKIGLFTLGGGLAIIALVRQETLAAGWLSAGEFSDILAIAQSTPGPIGVNAATFTGFRVFANQGAGLWLAVAASLMSTVAVTLPSVVGVGTGGAWFERHRENRYVVSVFNVLRPCVAGFVSAMGVTLTIECFAAMPPLSPCLESAVRTGSDIALFLAAAWAGWSNRFSPVWILAAGALAGLARVAIWPVQ